MFLDLLSARRSLRLQKAIRAAKAAAAVAEQFKISEVGRNAAAYGFEVGSYSIGHPMILEKLPAEVSATPDNPFLDPNWHERVVSDG